MGDLVVISWSDGISWSGRDWHFGKQGLRSPSFRRRAQNGQNSGGMAFHFRKVPVPSGRCEKIDFAEIWLDAKCMPMARRSLIGHPGATFLTAELTPHLFFKCFTSSS
jgi:hypothetical protein